MDEWYVLGEFHGRLDASTTGRLGDIRGKPTVEELRKVKVNAFNLGKSLP